MPATHGWDLDALQNYEADKRDRKRNREAIIFEERAADLRERYGVDKGYMPKEYAVDYENLVLDHAHLAGLVPEISEFLEVLETEKQNRHGQ